MGGVLSRVYSMLQDDIKTQPFDWIDSVSKEMAVCINCSLEAVALKYFSEKGLVANCEAILKFAKWSDKSHQEIICRAMNLVAKVAKVDASCKEIMNSKTILITCLLYYSSQESDDLAKQCLLTMHSCCKQETFKDICFNTHKLPQTTFDSFVKNSITKYEAIVAKESWNDYVNICASITAFVTAFPERLPEYKNLIVPLIGIVGSKTDLIRKNAAVLLAKLATNEDNAKIMRANHGTEVLLSLRQ